MGSEKRADRSMPRRDFLKHSVVTAGAIGVGVGEGSAAAEQARGQAGLGFGGGQPSAACSKRAYNDVYTGAYLDRVAFPMGGLGAGMVCLEGTGALSHLSIRNKPDIFNEPFIYAAVCVKGKTPQENIARVLEGPVPSWKLFGQPTSGNGGGRNRTWGLPRCSNVSFEACFPFATVKLADHTLPLKAEITGWSPFEPGDADNASLPLAALEYQLTNTAGASIEAVFSYNCRNVFGYSAGRHAAKGGDRYVVDAVPSGFVCLDSGSEEEPSEKGAFAVAVPDDEAKVNCGWFRGGWYDTQTMVWRDVQEGACYEQAPHATGDPSPGATVFVPFKLAPGQSKTIRVLLAWYAGDSGLRQGKLAKDAPAQCKETHKPWYASRFNDVGEVLAHWRSSYDTLRGNTQRFSKCFYDTNLPPEVIEAAAANLTILKSPTVLRQEDGRLWAYEGCTDTSGCCTGSCTHVWNYAQAVCHLFPNLERTLRETEYNVSQDERGHQTFRATLPICTPAHDFHAASDGQLGGVMKVYREWRISGDTTWMRKLWPKVQQSLAYCIGVWDPKHKGVLEEPHHNTYDIEFWGPDGMCSSFYLGALAAAVQMGKALGEDVRLYEELLAKGKQVVENELFNGEYFYQQIRWKDLQADPPTYAGSPEAVALFEKEGPKYQYGTGCLSDGVLGCWIALMCGLGADVLNREKVTSHLRSIHKYNLKHDLSGHANPQRTTYACGSEGGLLLCTWPRGGALSLPFVYSNEVWTGIEYQVASHLCAMGLVDEGLDIVRVCRDRYDGRVRNPFNEYECGHWYARAMSSYGLLQGLTGCRHDAVERVLYLAPRIKGDFRSFLSTATGYGTVGVKNGKPFLDVVQGTIPVDKIEYAPA